MFQTEKTNELTIEAYEEKDRIVCKINHTVSFKVYYSTKVLLQNFVMCKILFTYL